MRVFLWVWLGAFGATMGLVLYLVFRGWIGWDNGQVGLSLIATLYGPYIGAAIAAALRHLKIRPLVVLLSIGYNLAVIAPFFAVVSTWIPIEEALDIVRFTQEKLQFLLAGCFVYALVADGPEADERSASQAV